MPETDIEREVPTVPADEGASSRPAQPSPGQGGVPAVDWSRIQETVGYEVPEALRQAVTQATQETENRKDAKFTKELQELAEIKKKLQAQEKLADAGKAFADWLAEVERRNPRLHAVIAADMSGDFVPPDPREERIRQDMKAIQTVPDLLRTIEDRIEKKVREVATPYVQAFETDRKTTQLDAALGNFPKEIREKRQEVIQFWLKNPNLDAEAAIYATLGKELQRRAQAEAAAKADSGRGSVSTERVAPKKFGSVLQALRDARRTLGQE